MPSLCGPVMVISDARVRVGIRRNSIHRAHCSGLDDACSARLCIRNSKRRGTGPRGSNGRGNGYKSKGDDGGETMQTGLGLNEGR
jgi:hypothetical protein